MASFSETLENLLSAYSGTNSSTETTCVETVSHYAFYQVALAPATVICLILAFFEKRVRLWPHVLGGRPGFVYPMDVLTRETRISYCCAFGTIATLCLEIITDSKYAFEYKGIGAFKVFVLMASMLIYGIALSPMFVCLAVNSILSFGLGTLYIWAYAGLKFLSWFECSYSSEVMGFIVLRNIPELLFLVYLCLSFPFRFVFLIHRHLSKQKRTDAFEELKSEEELVTEIRESYHGLQLRRILRKPEPPPKEPQNKKEKIIQLARKIFNKVIYKREPGFRYSARILVIVTIGLTIIYALICEILILFITLYDLGLQTLEFTIATTVGYTYIPGEAPSVTVSRSSLLLAWYVIYCLKVCMIVSAVFATLIAIVMCLHGLCAYRSNLKALHKGDHSSIPPSSKWTFQSLLAGSMRFAGYQVAYMTWGWVLQFLVLYLVTVILAVFIICMQYGLFVDFVTDKIKTAVPALLVGLIINYVQVLLARFFFLQKYEKELTIGMDNRRVFFVLSYFIYFYNIFLGIVSCLLRIIKSLGLGLLLLSRLDLSTLPRKFEKLDPGFQAYIGFMHVESAHTHPVVITFCRIMSIPVRLKAAEKTESERESSIELGEKGKDAILEKRRTRKRVINNWQLLYTLFNNPELRIMRKGIYQKKIKNPKLYREEYLKTFRDVDDDNDIKKEILITPKQKFNCIPPSATEIKTDGNVMNSPENSVVVVTPTKTVKPDGNATKSPNKYAVVGTPTKQVKPDGNVTKSPNKYVVAGTPTKSIKTDGNATKSPKTSAAVVTTKTKTSNSAKNPRV